MSKELERMRIAKQELDEAIRNAHGAKRDLEKERKETQGILREVRETTVEQVAGLMNEDIRQLCDQMYARMKELQDKNMQIVAAELEKMQQAVYGPLDKETGLMILTLASQLCKVYADLLLIGKDSVSQLFNHVKNIDQIESEQRLVEIVYSVPYPWPFPQGNGS